MCRINVCTQIPIFMCKADHGWAWVIVTALDGKSQPLSGVSVTATGLNGQHCGVTDSSGTVTIILGKNLYFAPFSIVGTKTGYHDGHGFLIVPFSGEFHVMLQMLKKNNGGGSIGSVEQAETEGLISFG